MELHAWRGRRRTTVVLCGLGFATALACASQTGTRPDAAATGPAAPGADSSAAGPERGAAGMLGSGGAEGVVDQRIGSTLDEEARRVREAVPDAGVRREGDHLLVTLSGDAIFDAGSPRLRPDGYERLRSFARSLSDHPDTDVVVKGYTDAQGSEAYNLKLSEDRAEQVRETLMLEGVAPRRVKALGFGAQFPVATNDTPEGRQQNRRVELELRPDASLRDREAQGPTP